MADSLGPHYTPSDVPGLAGAGGAPPASDARAKHRALKTGEAVQRLLAALKILEIANTLYETASSDEISIYAEDAAAFEAQAVEIAREAIASLTPPAPQPLPGPSGREPIEPNSRP